MPVVVFLLKFGIDLFIDLVDFANNSSLRGIDGLVVLQRRQVIIQGRKLRYFRPNLLFLGWSLCALLVLLQKLLQFLFPRIQTHQLKSFLEVFENHSIFILELKVESCLREPIY